MALRVLHSKWQFCKHLYPCYVIPAHMCKHLYPCYVTPVYTCKHQNWYYYMPQCKFFALLFKSHYVQYRK